MIRIGGEKYGTAAETATAPGPDTTVAMIRNWAARDGLKRITVPGRGRGVVLYPLLQAARIEAAKRGATRGRPRPT